METVEVVIKIPDELYNATQTDMYRLYTENTCHTILEAIKNGTVLPKGHGQVDILDKITNLFNRWNNGEIDDNQYHFQMQNLLLFGKELEVKDGAANRELQ